MRLNLSQYSLPSDKLALSYESPDALDTLKAKLRSEHQPANETEEILVTEMAEQFWRLRRARVLETGLLDSDKALIPHLTATQRMMSSAERGFHKALRALRQLQKDRGFVPQKQESGLPRESASALGLVSQSDQNRDLACQGTSALARGAGIRPPATEPRPKEAVAPGSRSESASALGFVPPPCPSDEDIDPADWARAFEARRRVHAKVNS